MPPKSGLAHGSGRPAAITALSAMKNTGTPAAPRPPKVRIVIRWLMRSSSGRHTRYEAVAAAMKGRSTQRSIRSTRRAGNTVPRATEMATIHPVAMPVTCRYWRMCPPPQTRARSE